MNAAHFHLMLNHIPVLGALAVLTLIVYSAFRNKVEVTNLSLAIAVIVGVLSVPVFLTGEPAEEVIEHLAGVSENLIEAHEDFSVYALIMTELVAGFALYGLFSIKRKEELPKFFLKILILMAFINTAMMFYTANLGGKIRHAEIRSDGSH